MTSPALQARLGRDTGGLPTDLRRARASLTLVFLVLGGLTATWAARIPAVKGSLHLSSGTLGLALLGPAVGLVASTPATGAALTRWRPKAVIAVGLVLFTASLPLVAVAGGPASLFAVLLVWGAGSGVMDVAMNTEAAALQARAGRSIMSGLHACYSVGGLVGAGAGALAAGAGVPVGRHLLVAAGVGGALGALGLWGLGPTAAPAPAPARTHAERPRRLPRMSWGLVALGVVSFGSLLAEGATNDWSAVYLHTSLGTSVGFAAVGYTVFASTMTVGRLFGDRLTRAVGPVRLVRLSTLLAAVGFTVALLVGRPIVGLLGFGVLGLGLSIVVPMVFSAAARLGSAGPSLALVTGCGYVGLMAGPPLIGGLADAISLPAALGMVVAMTVLTAVLAPALAPPGPAARDS